MPLRAVLACEPEMELEQSLKLNIEDRMDKDWFNPAPRQPLEADVVPEEGQAEAEASAVAWKKWEDSKEDRELMLSALYRALVTICQDHEPLSDILSEIEASDGAKAWKEFQLFFVNRTNGRASRD